MIAVWEFESPEIWVFGLPLAVLTVFLAVRAFTRLGVNARRIIALAGLRIGALLGITFLLSRPVWVKRAPPVSSNRPVAVLIDRSESMSLEEGGATRFQQAVEFVRQHLDPAFQQAGLALRLWTFAENADPIDAAKLAGAAPNGKRTNLGGAIAQVLSSAENLPLAIIACTDGAANETADNQRALSGLAESRVPFFGLGFGSDQGVRTLSLAQVEAPEIVAPNADFLISAHLEMANGENMPPFDLVLFRDGAMAQKKSLQAGDGSRVWRESFRVTETEEGSHNYSIQLLPPEAPGLKCVSTTGTAAVRIRAEKELRVLFVQGALTWDYKFIGLALRSDPSIKVTGLTRTATNQVFRQNVESAGELRGGFPRTVEEIAPFRTVVLSNLKPVDLAPAQQELLGRFCSELGGGLLLLGGPATFDYAWQGTRLEQMLPVVLAGNPGVRGLDRPFRIQLADEALQNPVFQITDDASAKQAWLKLPTFTQYARVDAAKPGAQIWAFHASDTGPGGPRILLASQRYGAGLTSVLCVQNFWRWRLAKDAIPGQFDRFWRQFFRFLSESQRQDVNIDLADQELRPGTDVRITLEKQPSPQAADAPALPCVARIENDRKQVLREERLDLRPRQPVYLTMRAEKAGLYTVTVRHPAGQPIATRTFEIRDINLEYQNAGRNMENLRQWAALSDGLALKVEDCRDPADLVAQVKSKIEQIRQGKPERQPVGVNAWTLSALLACLSAEWLLRKRWRLT